MNKKDIVIIGSGGLAREVKWLIEECNKLQEQWNILGWISEEKPGTMVDGLPVLGNDEWLLRYERPIAVAVGIGSGSLRREIVTCLKRNSLISFPVLISPSAELSDSVVLGEGSIVAAKSILTVDIEIGAFFYCNLACTVGHDCKFENYVTLNPGSNISGNVILKECVTIGTGAAVVQGLTIGENTTIGAGAVVVSDTKGNCTAVGVPARPLEGRNE